MNPRIKELLSNTLLFSIANMGSKILVFLMVPLYTSVLSTDEYGISDMVHTSAQMMMPILTAMIAEAVLRFCFIKEYDNKIVFSIGVRFVLGGTLLCLLLSIVMRFIPYFESLSWYIFFIPVVFITQSGTNLFHKFARGIEKVKVSAIGGLIGAISVVSLNILFLLVLKLGVVGFLLAYSIADIIAISYMACRCKAANYWSRETDQTVRKQMLVYSMPLIPNQLSWWALSNITRYIMLGQLGVSVVGIYSATLRLPSILTVLSDIFAQAWLLSALKNYGTDESKKFIKSMHSRFFSLLIIMTALIILISYPLAKILLSGDFSSYWWITPYLFISVFWGALVGFLGSIFSAERKNNMQFISTLVGSFVAIIITLLFMKEYGVVVAAISTWAGYFVIWLLRRIAVNKYIDVGLSTVFSIIQGTILLFEGILVSKQLYLYAVVCVIILIALNFNELRSVVRFFNNEICKLLIKKIRNNG